jgi:hypothetical protein
LVGEELLARPAGTVQDQNGIVRVRRADGPIVQAQLRERFAARKMEISNYKIGFFWSRIVRRHRAGSDCQQSKQLHAAYCTCRAPR